MNATGVITVNVPDEPRRGGVVAKLFIPRNDFSCCETSDNPPRRIGRVPGPGGLLVRIAHICALLSATGQVGGFLNLNPGVLGAESTLKVHKLATRVGTGRPCSDGQATSCITYEKREAVCLFRPLPSSRIHLGKPSKRRKRRKRFSVLHGIVRVQVRSGLSGGSPSSGEVVGFESPDGEPKKEWSSTPVLVVRPSGKPWILVTS
ncbi:hypothetical protein HPB51_006535 [Rhipicephalus microplus]|uniref:Uncharacterized protein n=1 Tax=Rhipicephalus microplus TaxID=6941 RepID=A0A9J6E6J4_RHIMP|nr:hypothetical protein HPB51_006535 [Rhipicephalus microplus]